MEEMGDEIGRTSMVFYWYAYFSMFRLVTDMNETSYRRKYCGKKMNPVEYDLYNGYCGTCRDVIDWKKLLKEYKDNR